jgi:(E)-4-hydroxy-3-methylbut-2-enyl-diphosphate synthase
VDTLFEEIDKSLDRGGQVEFDEAESREGAEWVATIERENAGDLTPEKIAQMEHEASQREENERVTLDEEASPTAGRRFTRA